MRKIYAISCIGIIMFFIYAGIINPHTKSEYLSETERIQSKQETIKNADKYILDFIYETDYIVVLFSDGSVWSYGNNINGMTGLGEGIYTSSFQEIDIGEQVLSIHKNTQNILVYTENGNVYGWGTNSVLMLDLDKKYNKIFYEPVKIPFQNKLAAFASKNNKYFAVDENGYFYTGGYIPPDGIRTSDFENGKIIPNKEFMNTYGMLVENTEKIFPGAGNYNYFIKNDGTVYSIMGYTLQADSGRPKGFIFPVGSNIIRTNNPRTNGATIISGNQEIGYAYIYFELENLAKPKLIDSDNDTMFYLDENGNAYYWYSEVIKYKEDNYLLFREHSPYEGDSGSGENYEGHFVNINEIAIDETIVDIKSAQENTMFLTSNGNVWISKYKITGSEENVSYYVSGVSRPYPGHVETRESAPISEMIFEKLEIDNIKYISTNSTNQFITINSEGLITCWDATNGDDIIKGKEITLSDFGGF